MPTHNGNINLNKTLLLLFALLLAGNVLAQGQKPNIVYILADDMGIGDVSGLNPDGKIHTPNIDRLMENGMTFTDAHAAASVCTPTRYGILTGRYAWRTQLKQGVLNGYSGRMIADTIDTAPELLQRNGYRTAMIGKWHLGWNWAIANSDSLAHDSKRPYNFNQKTDLEVDFSQPFAGGPTDNGFDYFYGISASLDFPPYVYCENDRVTEIPAGFQESKGGKDPEHKQKMMRSGVKAKDFDAGNTMLNLTRHAVDYIEDYESPEPFFLYVSFTAPHTPVLPRKEFSGTSGAGIYGDFIHELDWSVGQIVKALEDKGMDSNTLVIFTADNGASRVSFPIAFEKVYGHKPSRELKGRKGSLHEGGHRVPFVVQWKGVVEPASVNNNTICLNDFYATCAALTDEKVEDNQGPDSFDMLCLLKGDTAGYKRLSTVYTNFGGRFSVRKGDWKLNLNPDQEKRKLYNLKEDISEKNNLYGKPGYEEIEHELTAEISSIITDGRSTKGSKLQNDGGTLWPQVYWLREKKKAMVFFLAGQSNMDGRARAYKLTAEDKTRLEKAGKNVTLYYNHQNPVPLQVTTANEYIRKKFGTEQVFGPELFFGIRLSEAYPDRQIILIKRSKGGMSLYGAWNPDWTKKKAKHMAELDDPKLYSDFVAYAKSVLENYDTTDDALCGMLWVQGETDSNTKKFGNKPAVTYEKNLKNLINGVRHEFHMPELPFIIFQVGSGKVVEAMKHLAKEDNNISLIPQEADTGSAYYFVRNPLPVGHYTYESMKKIGNYFFEFFQEDYKKNCNQ